MVGEPHEQCEKANMYDTERWASQVGRCPIDYWRRAEKYLQKEWRSEPRKNDTTRHMEMGKFNSGDHYIRYCLLLEEIVAYFFLAEIYYP